MGCNLQDIAPAEQTSLKALAGKRVGIDAFLTAFNFSPRCAIAHLRATVCRFGTPTATRCRT